MTKNQLKIYNMALFIIVNAIPVIILSVLYTRMAYKLWKPDILLTHDNIPQQKNQTSKIVLKKSRQKTIIMLLTVVLFFFLCVSPMNIFNVIMSFCDQSEFNIDILLHAMSIIRILPLVNSASNLIIYNFFSLKFRTRFRSVFTR